MVDRDALGQDGYIRRALAAPGGHLSIGRGGFSLHFDRGAHLSGYDVEPIKAACIAAGLPVIDSRMVPFEDVARIAINGPMVAVDEEPSPAPWRALSYAPLAHIAGLYRAVGAEVFNLPDVGARGGRGDPRRHSVSVPNLASYDRFVVAFSGGKDSIACVLDLLERGVPPERIELHHHDVDGQGETFMDWPSTAGYCRAIADALTIPLYLSWREGGFIREMLRQNQPTAPIRFETAEGHVGTAGGHGPLGTRLRFPQVSANLSVRWCSAYCKIDVLAALIRAQERFAGARTLVITGERAEESANRARYQPLERHRTDARAGHTRRHVDHWRPVHGWSTEAVWAALQRHGIVPAPAYRLGWSRLSCAACIFSSADQWATLRFIAPAWFDRIAHYEERFGCTIRRNQNIRELADRGRPYAAAIAQPALVKQALSKRWDGAVLVEPSHWQLPVAAHDAPIGPN